MTAKRVKGASDGAPAQILVKGRITLLFDADQTTAGQAEAQAVEAIRQINLTLQREPYGLAAQIFVE